MDINVKGAFFVAQEALPLLGEGSTITFTTSVINEKGMAGATAYAATKGGLRSLVRSLSVELVGKGIRVNAVSPGPIATTIFNKMGLPEAQMQAMSEQIQTGIPMGRFGNPEDIAKAVAYLASDDASFVTGAELQVDGGYRQA